MTITKRFNQISLIGLCLLVFFLIPFAGASGEMVRESDFIGTWTGVITTAASTNPVDLTITSSKETPSAISYSLHYGPPKSCRLNAVKASMNDKVISLVFNEASGGYCDKLWKKGMNLELIDKESLRLTIQSIGVDITLAKMTD